MPQGWGILPQNLFLPVGMSAIYWFFPEQYPRMSRPPPPRDSIDWCITMFFKNHCVLVLWTKVASALEGLIAAISPTQRQNKQISNVLSWHTSFPFSPHYKAATSAADYLWMLVAHPYLTVESLSSDIWLQFRLWAFLHSLRDRVAIVWYYVTIILVTSCVTFNTPCEALPIYSFPSITISLQLLIVANTKWCKKTPENDWNLGTWVLMWEYLARAL